MVSTPGLSGRERKFEPGKFSSFSHPWNNFGKFYGIKSPEYFYVCNFIPSTLRSIDRNSAKNIRNLSQCGIELRTVATFALEVRLSNHLDTSHPHSASSHPHSARAHPHLAKSHPLSP